MQFIKGQSVMALDDDLEGVIVDIDGEWISVESSDGFIVRFRESEILPLKKLHRKALEVPETVLKEKEPKPPKKASRVKPKDRNLPPMEVDLHIHQLTNRRGMSNHDMLTLQLETAERQLQFAIQKRISKVVFIHGVGKGVLRSELEYLFRRYENITYYDADYQKYGVGALEVYIYQNTPAS